MTAAVAGTAAELAGAESAAATGGASASRAGAAASGSATPAARKAAPRKATRSGKHRKPSTGPDLATVRKQAGKIKPAIEKAPRANLKGHGRRVLVAEFVACAVVVAFSPLTDKHKQDSPVALMKRSSAVAVLFFLLALVSTAGRGASRIAAAFGGLVLVVLLVSERDLFAVLAQRFNANPNAGPAGPPPDIGGELGSAVGAVVAEGVP